MSENPVGMLLLDSEARAKAKASQVHTSKSKTCGCQVTTSWFGPGGRSTRIEACHEHESHQRRRLRTET